LIPDPADRMLSLSPTSSARASRAGDRKTVQALLRCPG
jgi:hypothetical protein